MECIKALVFDFDGVIVESNNIKHDAIREIFSGYDCFAQIWSYHIESPSVVRGDKFDHILRNIMFIEGEEAAKLKSKWLEDFSRLTEEAIFSCDEVPGAKRLLEHFKGKINMYLASATPEDVLQRIVETRGLSDFFVKSYGAPIVKSEVLKEISSKENIPSEQLLFIGDSPSDQKAAETAKTSFYARKSDYDFVGVPVKNNLHEILQDLIERGLA